MTPSHHRRAAAVLNETATAAPPSRWPGAGRSGSASGSSPSGRRRGVVVGLAEQHQRRVLEIHDPILSRLHFINSPSGT